MENILRTGYKSKQHKHLIKSHKLQISVGPGERTLPSLSPPLASEYFLLRMSFYNFTHFLYRLKNELLTTHTILHEFWHLKRQVLINKKLEERGNVGLPKQSDLWAQVHWVYTVLLPVAHCLLGTVFIISPLS